MDIYLPLTVILRMPLSLVTDSNDDTPWILPLGAR